jgi:nodulation protein E
VSRREVVVTGLGAVTAAGMGAEALWTAAVGGVSGNKPLTFTRNYSHSIKHAAQAPDIDVTAYLPDRKAAYFDRTTTLGIVAAMEAVKDAGLDDVGPLGNRTAVIVGTGVGSLGTIEEGAYNLLEGRRPDPLSVPRAMTSAAASHIGMIYGCTGPSFVISSACASSAQALGIAMQMLRAGMIDRAIVAGCESIITSGGMKGWEAMRVLSPDFCRPFSKGRNGLLLGEGAAVLVLETADGARQRGARVRARLLGYGTTSDAKDMLRPDTDGATEAMAIALADAGVDAGSIDYVNAHGTATLLNDSTESEALGRIFGNRVGSVAVSSTKPIHGHTLGAAGAIEAIVTIRAMEEGRVPPTINFLAPDPNCPIDCVPNEGRTQPIGMALSNSFAFGGINAALVFGRAH